MTRFESVNDMPADDARDDGWGSDEPDMENEDTIRNALKRKEAERNAMHCMRMAFLILSSIATLGIALASLWHIVGPEMWRWISAAGIGELRNLATTIITCVVLSMATEKFIRGK